MCGWVWRLLMVMSSLSLGGVSNLASMQPAGEVDSRDNNPVNVNVQQARLRGRRTSRHATRKKNLECLYLDTRFVDLYFLARSFFLFLSPHVYFSVNREQTYI